MQVIKKYFENHLSIKQILRMGADRHNGIFMSLLLLVAEIKTRLLQNTFFTTAHTF